MVLLFPPAYCVGKLDGNTVFHHSGDWHGQDFWGWEFSVKQKKSLQKSDLF